MCDTVCVAHTSRMALEGCLCAWAQGAADGFGANTVGQGTGACLSVDSDALRVNLATQRCIFANASGPRGAIFMPRGSYVSDGDVFTGCAASDPAGLGGDIGSGGAIAFGGSSAVLRNTSITHCTATGHGGGIHLSAGSVSLVGARLAHNSAGVGGGGLAASTSAVVLDAVSFVSNTGGVNGGGVACSRCALTAVDSVWRGNAATSQYGLGGAVYGDSEAVLSLGRCGFSGTHGGAFNSTTGAYTGAAVPGSAVDAFQGAAIYTSGAVLTVTESTFSDLVRTARALQRIQF